MKITDDITDFIFLEHKLRNADIIFIPGGSYAETAEKAATLFANGYSNLILPSGNCSITLGVFDGPKSKLNIYSNNYSTEWEFLNDVLIKNGVPTNSILEENKATYTYENALFSKEVTDRKDLNIQKAIICCKSFHARRAFMYYQLVYPNTEFIICPVDIDNINKYNWFKSNSGIDIVMDELSKCGNQIKDNLKIINSERL
ncbi:MAG: YdcF family protein [Clostridium sp.]